MAEIRKDTTETPMTDLILKIVNDSSGIKAVELVLEVIGEDSLQNFNYYFYRQILKGLIDRGEILELEYILPQINYRTKSIFFPKGTKIARIHY